MKAVPMKRLPVTPWASGRKSSTGTTIIRSIVTVLGRFQKTSGASGDSGLCAALAKGVRALPCSELAVSWPGSVTSSPRCMDPSGNPVPRFDARRTRTRRVAEDPAAARASGSLSRGRVVFELDPVSSIVLEDPPDVSLRFRVRGNPTVAIDCRRPGIRGGQGPMNVSVAIQHLAQIAHASLDVLDH